MTGESGRVRGGPDGYKHRIKKCLCGRCTTGVFKKKVDFLNVSLQVDDFLQTDFIPYLQIAICISPQ